MLSNCGSDERGKYTGGKPGDQTGGEWAIINWYNRPWKCVLRHPDAAVREKIAQLSEAAARNNLVGYCQGHRGTYWQHLKASGYDPAKITVKCEADCSSGVAANVKAAGYLLGVRALQNVSTDMYTGNQRQALKNAGFAVLTDAKYLTSDAYLLRGDILLNDGHHTATNITTGSKAVQNRPGTTGKPGAAAGEQKHTVKSGETLGKIAALYGTTVQKLASYNGIANPDKINAGQIIKIPGVRTYTVKPGDTLWKIADAELGDGQRFNEIKTLNGLTSTTIIAGQTLKLPER